MSEQDMKESIDKLQSDVSLLSQIKSRKPPESMFHRGPRALGLWIGMYGLFYEVVVRTHATALVQLMGKDVSFMELRPDVLWLVAGMGLGLSGLRSLDKKNGVT
jgi:hypothetical protein